jgi:hypothetical protein
MGRPGVLSVSKLAGLLSPIGLQSRVVSPAVPRGEAPRARSKTNSHIRNGMDCYHTRYWQGGLRENVSQQAYPIPQHLQAGRVALFGITPSARSAVSI